MGLDPVLLRHPVTGPDGLMTAPWVRQQGQVQGGAQVGAAIVEAVTGNSSPSLANATAAADLLALAVAAAVFDDRNPVDYGPLIWEAYLQDPAPSPRDFGPALQDVQLTLVADSPRVYDDAELRNALAGDVSGSGAPALGLQQQIDELRALIAAGDPFPGDLVMQNSPVSSVFGRSGAITAQSSDYSAFYDAAGAAASAQAASLPTYLSESAGSVASGTAQTMYTFPTNTIAVYSVNAHIGASGNTTQYAAWAIIAIDTSSAKLMTSVQGGLLIISLSGMALQVTQSSGVAQPLYASILRIG